VKERLVDIRSSLVAHQNSAVPRQPRQRALHHPPMPSEPLAGVFPSPSDAALDPSTRVSLKRALSTPNKTVA
jgi:hypothetical protein